jgi:hypothetical protein
MGMSSFALICYRAICTGVPKNTAETSVTLFDSWGPGSKSVPCGFDVVFHHDVTSLTRLWFPIIYCIRIFML